LGGVFGGWLSDAVGRNTVLLGSIFVGAIAFLTLQFAAGAVQVMLVNIVISLAASFYEPVSKAMISDRLVPARRLKAFSDRYMATNIGYAIGPLMGAYMGLMEHAIGFLLTGCAYLLFFAGLYVVLRTDTVGAAGSPIVSGSRSLPAALQAIVRDGRLMLFTVGSTLALAVHGQMSVTFSQYLNASFADGVAMFAWLISVNAVTVIVSQPVLRHVAERKGALTSIVVGALALSAGAVGFSQAGHLTGLVVAMVVFTWGEVLLVPAEYSILDSITPEPVRGAYYGAHSLSSLGNLLGPWLGGIVLMSWGGHALFYSMAAVALLSMLIFVSGSRMQRSSLKGGETIASAK
jgi:MFS family permease